MTREEFVAAVDAKIESLIEQKWFGTPSARRTGRNPRWPYVPVVEYEGRQDQVRGLAYATRAEALAAATGTIGCRFDGLRANLLNARHRALRESHGLPREVPE